MTEKQSNFKEKIFGKINSINKNNLLIALLIFILAFAIRGSLMGYELMWGFDTFYHARYFGYTVQGEIQNPDPLAYYQFNEFTDTKIGPPKSSYFFWQISTLIYKVFTLGAGYDKDMVIFFVKLLPALFGALISVSMFFLGKEMYGKKAGIVMGVIASVVPSFVYRTMAGQFEEDALGFLWLVIGFYFFVKAINKVEFNKESIKNALIAGVFFGLMAITWDFFLIIPLTMGAYAFWTLVLMWFRNETKEKLVNFVKIFAITMVLFAVIATIADEGNWIRRTTSYISEYAPISAENIERASSKGPGIISQTVGEENLGYPFWGQKYSALIFLPFLALFLIIYRELRNKSDHVSLILFFWILISVYLAYHKLKFTYVFGLPIAASAGIVFTELFIFLGNRTKLEKKIVAIAMAFILLVGVGAGSYFVTTQYPNIEQPANGWKQALIWMKNNTPKDSRVFNWWDEGHWITFIGERKVIVDNRNVSAQGSMDFAKFILLEDLNAAYDLVKEYKADYVILSSDLLGKQSALALYAYNTTNVQDPRVQRTGFNAVMLCNAERSQLTGQANYKCGGNNLTEKQINELPSQWTEVPNQVSQGRQPLYIYKDETNDRIFALTPAANKTMLTRMWFKDPKVLEKFEVAFENAGTMIFKVK